MVVASAGHVGGTGGSGIVFSAANMLWISVVRGMRRVGGVGVWLGAAWVEGGEWMRGFGLGFTNPVGTGGVLDVCLYLGLGEEWLGGLDQGL